MDSIWLSCDDDSFGEADHAAQPFQDSLSYMGIFTEAPSAIGRMLPRPEAPFPGVRPDVSAKGVEPLDASGMHCVSPPSGLPRELDNMRFSRIACPLVFF